MDSTKWIFYYSRLCGICYFVDIIQSPTKLQQKFLKIWMIFHLILLSTIVSITIRHAQEIFILDGVIESAIDLLQWFLPITSHYISIVQSFYTDQTRRQFWHRLLYIDKHLLKIPSLQLNKIINKFIIKSLIILVVAITTQVYVMVRVASDSHWHNNLSSTLFTFIVCCSEGLICVYYIEMVKFRVDAITQRLIDIPKVNKNRFTLIQLRTYKKCYELLWHAMEDVNQAFGRVN